MLFAKRCERAPSGLSNQRVVVLECVQGYYVASNGMACLPCEQNCAACVAGAAAATETTTTTLPHNSGFNNTGSIPFLAQQGASQAGSSQSASSVCVLAVPGYYLSASSITAPQPIPCAFVDAYCTVCHASFGDVLCDRCGYGYFLSADSTCQECVGVGSDCAECGLQDGEIACKQCAYGYYLLQNSTCAPCSA